MNALCGIAVPGVLLLVLGHSAGRRPPDATSRPAAAVVPMANALSGNVDHGRYLVERVIMCAECHSDRDANGHIIPSTRFMGGPIPFRPPWPNDWAMRAPRNAGLPGYTDELAIRLLTQGAIDRQGRQLRLPMPRFRMTTQDAADVVAFMRTIE